MEKNFQSMSNPRFLTALMKIIICFLFVSLLSGPLFSSAKEPEILAGAAENNITPPIGLDIMHPHRANTGVHDPLFLRALVLKDQHGTSVAIITADLICTGFAAMDELRKRVKEKAGMNEVWFNTSHAHSARWLRATPLPDRPWTDEMIWDEYYSHQMKHGSKEFKWNKMVHETAVNTVIEAKNKLTPVQLHAGRAPVQIGYNRRVANPDGWIYMGVNKKGAAVPWVNVLVARELQNNNPIAVLFEHPAHPVTVPPNNNLVSADFPGAAVATIRKDLGPKVIAMYGQGCCGNINSFPLRSSLADAQTAGEKLGLATLQAIKNSEPISATKITLRSNSIKIPTRKLPDKEMISELKKKNKNQPHRIKQLNKISKLQEKMTSPPPRRFDVYGVLLGKEWGLIGMSYETFSQYELWIDKNAPFKKTMVFSLTNGGRAYIGTDESLAMGRKGGYEAASLPNWSGHETMSPSLGPPAVGCEKLIHEALESLWNFSEPQSR
tara:strand:- start:404 stop:1888 length:1485 start_codon:yes stop_codon:yes gene_type:complete